MKVLYILSFILDMLLLPFITLIAFITTIVFYVKDVITGDIKIFEWRFKDYIMQFVEFVKSKVNQGLYIHKNRILGL